MRGGCLFTLCPLSSATDSIPPPDAGIRHRVPLSPGPRCQKVYRPCGDRLRAKTSLLRSGHSLSFRTDGADAKEKRRSHSPQIQKNPGLPLWQTQITLYGTQAVEAIFRLSPFSIPGRSFQAGKPQAPAPNHKAEKSPRSVGMKPASVSRARPFPTRSASSLSSDSGSAQPKRAANPSRERPSGARRRFPA